MKVQLTVRWKNGAEKSKIVDIDDAFKEAALAEGMRGFSSFYIEPARE